MTNGEGRQQNLGIRNAADCDCGAPLVGGYAKMTGECSKCEDRREGEIIFSMMCDQRYARKGIND